MQYLSSYHKHFKSAVKHWAWMNQLLRILCYALPSSIAIASFSIFYQIFLSTNEYLQSSFVAALLLLVFVDLMIYAVLTAGGIPLSNGNASDRNWRQTAVTVFLYTVISLFLGRTIALVVAWKTGTNFDPKQLIFLFSIADLIFVATFTFVYRKYRLVVQRIRWI